MQSVRVYLYAQRGMSDGAAAGLKLTILCMPSSADGSFTIRDDSAKTFVDL